MDVDEGKRVQHGEIIGVYPGLRSSLPFLQIGGGGGGLAGKLHPSHLH